MERSRSWSATFGTALSPEAEGDREERDVPAAPGQGDHAGARYRGNPARVADGGETQQEVGR